MGILSAIGKVASKVVGKVAGSSTGKKVASKVGSIFSSGAKKTTSSVASSSGGFFSRVWNGIKSIPSKISSAFKSGSTAAKALGKNGIWGGIKNVVKTVGKKIPFGIGAAITLALEAPDMISAYKRGGFSELLKAAGGVGIELGALGIGTYFGGLPGAIVGGIVGMIARGIYDSNVLSKPDEQESEAEGEVGSDAIEEPGSETPSAPAQPISPAEQPSVPSQPSTPVGQPQPSQPSSPQSPSQPTTPTQPVKTREEELQDEITSIEAAIEELKVRLAKLKEQAGQPSVQQPQGDLSSAELGQLLKEMKAVLAELKQEQAERSSHDAYEKLLQEQVEQAMQVANPTMADPIRPNYDYINPFASASIFTKDKGEHDKQPKYA